MQSWSHLNKNLQKNDFIVYTHRADIFSEINKQGGGKFAWRVKKISKNNKRVPSLLER